MLKKAIVVFSAVVAIIALLVGIFGISVIAYANKNIDYEFDKRMLLDAKNRNTTMFYAFDKSGEEELVWQLNREYKTRWVPLSDISHNVIDAFISSEDREFYNHNGVNFKRTIYALANYALKFNSQFGASTITQQLIKNLSGDNAPTVKRKISEILRAMKIEKQFSKDEILELYLNIVPLSDNLYGVGEASRVYFNKAPAELNVKEAATLAGIINAPSRYNPYRHPDECLKKRNNVLYAMLENGKISDIEYQTFKNTELGVAPKAESHGGATPWFVETAVDEILKDLAAKYNISRQGAEILLNSGLQVHLTMEKDVQKILNSYFEERDNFPLAIESGLNFSMAIYNSKTGNLSAIVGAVGKKSADKISNYSTTNITPASTLKPIALYAPLLDEGKINWSTVFDDTPVIVSQKEGKTAYYPKNSPNKYDGLITVKDALRFSKNTVAARMYEMLGSERIYQSLKYDYGFNTLVESKKDKSGSVHTDLDIAPLALGQLTDGIPLTTLTHAYTVFPSEGLLGGGKSYFYINDSKGERILQNENSAKRVIKPLTARLMTQMLTKVVEEGTAHSITLSELVDTAGKSGTSGGDLDRLFIGYTPYYTAGIWCGYPVTRNAIGMIDRTHLGVWDDVMRKIHNECIIDTEDNLDCFSTEDLIELEYCRDSGQLVGEGCLLDLRENRIAKGYFTSNNMPNEECHRHCIIEYDDEIYSLLDYERENFPGISISDDKYLLKNHYAMPKLNEIGSEEKKNGFFDFLKRFF